MDMLSWMCLTHVTFYFKMRTSKSSFAVVVPRPACAWLILFLIFCKCAASYFFFVVAILHLCLSLSSLCVEVLYADEILLERMFLHESDEPVFTVGLGPPPQPRDGAAFELDTRPKCHDSALPGPKRSKKEKESERAQRKEDKHAQKAGRKVERSHRTRIKSGDGDGDPAGGGENGDGHEKKHSKKTSRLKSEATEFSITLGKTKVMKRSIYVADSDE
jgi:hypothetical protein